MTLARGEVIELLQAIADNTREIADLLEIAYGAELKRRLAPVLSDRKRTEVYSLSTGELSTRQIAQRVGVSDKTVRDWWRDWAAAGLMKGGAVEGRFVRRYDPGKARLVEGGIEE
jgi:transposase-like protein